MILYPQLLKHKNVEPFWKHILERVSIGDTPYGTRLVQDVLVFQNQQLPLKNSNYEQVIEFFKHTVCLDLQYIHFEHWKDIKRKSIKDNLIQNFIQRFSLKHNLNTNQSEYLLSLVQLFITLKKITPNDILLETDIVGEHKHTFIKSIVGLSYQNDTIIFNPNHEVEELSDSSDEEEFVEDEIIEEEIFQEDDNTE